jgi:hypothetical protein
MDRQIIQSETLAMLEASWPDIMHDMETTKRELIQNGYEVISIIPGQVILNFVDEKFGFLMLIPDSSAEEIKKRVKADVFFSLDAAFGQNQDLLVFLVTLINESEHLAITCPIYFHVSEKHMIVKNGTDDFYIFFRNLSGDIVLSLKTDKELFLNQ